MGSLTIDQSTQFILTQLDLTQLDTTGRILIRVSQKIIKTNNISGKPRGAAICLFLFFCWNHTNCKRNLLLNEYFKMLFMLYPKMYITNASKIDCCFFMFIVCNIFLAF